MPCRLPPFTMSDARRVQQQLEAWDVEAADLMDGMNVEREHCRSTRGDPIKTATIALDHLRERGDYYERLKRYVER